MRARAAWICFFLWLFAPSIGRAVEQPANYVQAVNESMEIILRNVHASRDIKGLRLAVAQFTGLPDGRECPALSDALESQVVSAMEILRTSMFAGSEEAEAAAEPFTILRAPGRDDEDILLQCDLLITGTWERTAPDSWFLTIRCVEFGEFGDYDLCVVVRKVSLEGLVAEQSACLGKSGPRPPQGSAVRDLQRELRSMDDRIDALLREPGALNRKIRLTGLMQERARMLDALKRAGQESRLTYGPDPGLNVAWLNIDTRPAGLEIYIDDRYVGQAPLREYPVQAGAVLRLEARGDLRYYVPYQERVRLGRQSRRKLLLQSRRGTGRILCVGEIPLDTVLADGAAIRPFDPDKPAVDVSAGRTEFVLWAGDRFGVFALDVWQGDVLTLEYANLTQARPTPQDRLLRRRELLDLREKNRVLERRVRRRLEQARTLQEFQAAEVYTLGPTFGPAASLAVTANGDLLAVGGRGRIRLMDRKTKTSNTVSAGSGPVLALALDPEGDNLAFGTGSGRVKILNVRNIRGPGREIPVFEAKESVSSLAFSPDGAMLAAGGSGGRIALVRTKSGEIVRTITAYPYSEFVNSLTFSPGGKSLVTRLQSGTVVVWEVPDGRKTAELPDTREYSFPLPFSPAFSSDGKLLATTKGREFVALWDVEREKRQTDFGPLPDVAGVAWFPYDWCLSGWNEDSLVFWDVKSYREAARITGLNAAFVAPAGDGSGFAACIRGQKGDFIQWWPRP